MPYTGPAAGYRAPIRSAGTIAPQEHAAAAERISNQRGAISTLLGGGVALGAVDLIDTVASSIPVVSRQLGIQREDVNRSVLRAFDSPYLNDFYQDTRGAQEIGSAIQGVIAAELVVNRFTKPAGLLMRTASRLPYVRRIAALDRQYDLAMDTVRQLDVQLARRGTLGSQQYSGIATAEVGVWDAATGAFSTATREVARNQAVRSARLIGTARGVRHAAATEAVMATTLNENGFLYTEDASTNLAWMVAGLAIGGAAESLFTSYRVRKIASSDLVTREFAAALDPELLEAGRLEWHGRAISPDVAKIVQNQTFTGGVHTDRITALGVEAEKLIQTAGVDAGHQTRMAQLATQKRDEGLKLMQTVSGKGIWHDGRSRFLLDSEGYGNHIRQAYYQDPAIFNGAEEIGAIPEGLTAPIVHSQRQTRMQEVIGEIETKLAMPKLSSSDQDLLRLELKRLKYLRDETQPMVLMDGELMPISEAEVFEDFIVPKVRHTRTRTGGVAHAGLWEVETKTGKSAMSIDDNLIMHFPGGKTLDNADHNDVMRMYHLSREAIDTLKHATDPIKLPENPNWFQLDMAEEIIRASEGRVNIVWPAGMTRESAQVESLAQKAASLPTQRSRDMRARSKADKSGVSYDGMLSRMRVRYNLPRLTAFERGVTGQAEHPIESLLRGMNEYGPDKVRQMTLSEVQETFSRQKRIGDMVGATSRDKERLAGNSFNFMRDEAGKVTKPVLVYKRNLRPEVDWTTENLVERLAARKVLLTQALTDPRNSPFNSKLNKALLESEDFHVASQPHKLMETQIQGSITGAAPQNVFGAFAKSLVTSEWIARDAPVLSAPIRLRDMVDRLTRDYLKTVVDSAFGDSLSVLKNPRNAKTRLLLSNLYSQGNGWTFKPELLDQGDGFFRFVLADTEENRRRFMRQFGREMVPNQPLIDASGTVVVLDDLGKKIHEAYQAADGVLLNDQNGLLKAVGRRGIRTKEHYIPPPSTRGTIKGFVLDANNEVVPGYTVLAKNQETFDREMAKTIDRMERELGMGYVFHTESSIKDFNDIWARAERDFIDPELTAVKPNQRGQGKLVGGDLSVTAFDDALTRLRDGFMRQGNDVMTRLMEDTITAAQMRSHITASTQVNSAGFFRNEKFRNVYDYYLENLTGSSKLNAEGSIFGRIYNPIEGNLDKMLEATVDPLYRGAQGVWRATDGWIRARMPGRDSAASRADFNSLTRALGEYMPFKNAAQMAERESAAKTPVSVQKITGELNRFTAAVVLRMFEVAHPVMNLAGMVNAMPAVLRHMRRLPGEAAEEWAQRIGHSAQIFSVHGQQIAIPDMTKIASRAFKRAWSRSSHADYDYMVRHGYLSQEVAEFQRQFGSIESKGAWERFFYGDPATNSKGVTGWTSILSDRSEDFTRSWGHMVGLELAENLGIKGQAARHTFAHDIANKMIANYNPRNRPEFLQGALGAPIGLFQSFIYNYYQRLFRYAETKDYQSIAMQYGVQGGLFGVTSLTGWNQLNSLLMNSSKGEQDIDSGIWSKLGGPAGDLLAGGALSNLPALFGAPAVDLFSRGDTNVRVPGVGGSSIPSISVLTRMWDGINRGLEAFSQNHPGMTSTQLSEIASNMIANRPLAGVIEQFGAGGFDTDSYGQVVSETQSAAEAAYRLIGLRSMRQSNEINAFYSDKDAGEYQAAAQDTLRRATRAAIREGNMDAVPAIYESYLRSGGSPRNFRRWLRDNVEAATTTRSQRRLDELLNDPTNMETILNYLDRGVSISEDEGLGDTGQLYSSSDPQDELSQDTLSLGQYGNQMTLDQNPDPYAP